MNTYLAQRLQPVKEKMIRNYVFLCDEVLPDSDVNKFHLDKEYDSIEIIDAERVGNFYNVTYQIWRSSVKNAPKQGVPFFVNPVTIKIPMDDFLAVNFEYLNDKHGK